MTVILAKKLGRLALVTTATVLVNGMVLQNIYAQEVNLDTLCQKFPLNSRCQAAVSATESQAPQIIKMKLKTSGRDNEWIRIERSGNTVKLLHTTRSNRGISGLVNGALGAVSPVPLPGLNFSRWNDHPTTRVAFEPDSCSKNTPSKNTQPISSLGCTITGTDMVSLVDGMDIRSGRFMIEYTEGNLLRSITFRLPAEDSRVAKKNDDLMAQNWKSRLESSR